LKIARALQVPTDWLFNDEADWPPPSFGFDPRDLGNAELMAEVLRRRMMAIREFGPVVQAYRRFSQTTKSILDAAAKRNQLEEDDHEKLKQAKKALDEATTLFIPGARQWDEFENRLIALDSGFAVEPERSEMRQIFEILATARSDAEAVARMLHTWGVTIPGSPWATSATPQHLQSLARASAKLRHERKHQDRRKK
jgi:hypothetical protein